MLVHGYIHSWTHAASFYVARDAGRGDAARPGVEIAVRGPAFGGALSHFARQCCCVPMCSGSRRTGCYVILSKASARRLMHSCRVRAVGGAPALFRNRRSIDHVDS